MWKLAQTMDILPGTRGYKTHMRKQSKRSIAGKKRWAAMSAEQKQVILDRLKKHREARKKV